MSASSSWRANDVLGLLPARAVESPYLTALLATLAVLVLSSLYSSKPLQRAFSNRSLDISAPNFVLNLRFALKAPKLFQQGYDQFKNEAYHLTGSGGEMVVLPHHLLEELAALPTSVASPQLGLDRDLQGKYTGVHAITDNHIHYTILQRKLTPRIPLLIPRMEAAVARYLREAWGSGTEGWVERPVMESLAVVSARVAADAIVGPEFADDPTWLHVSSKYTESVFGTAVMLRTLPKWSRSVLYPLLPGYWEAQRFMRTTRELLGPRIRDLLARGDRGEWAPRDDSADDANLLTLMCAGASGADRDPDVLSQALVLISMASVHTTLARVVNILYDVTGAAGDGLLAELLAEMAEQNERVFVSGETSTAKAGGGGEAAKKAAYYDGLEKLDSVMRESQRMTPPVATGMKRVFRSAHTFSDGTAVPAGAYACMPVFAIENDEAHTADPRRFDGLRYYRARRALLDGGDGDGGGDSSSNKNKGQADREFLFTSLTRTSLNFGYGKTACPGRYFAGYAIKVILDQILRDYELDFVPGAARPVNFMFHEFSFPPPGQKMRIRRKA